MSNWCLFLHKQNSAKELLIFISFANLISGEKVQFKSNDIRVSSHCEYIQNDSNVNCYVKMLLDNIEREMNVNVAQQERFHTKAPELIRYFVHDK